MAASSFLAASHDVDTRVLINRIARHAALWTVTLIHGGFAIYLIAR